MEESALWVPKTQLGKEVLENRITIDEIFKSGRKIKESKIVDMLLPDLKSEVVFIGDSPGKGGGSRKTPTRRTTRMHRSGRKYTISSLVIVGNENGYLGIGKAKGKDHRRAIEKATENAKLNIIPVRRGCGSWECRCGEKHSIPFKVEGKAGSVRVILKPAPKGIGLCIGSEAKKLLRLAGIKDIWSKAFGERRSRINYMFALFDALKKMNKMKVDYDFDKELSTEKESKETEEKAKNGKKENKKKAKTEKTKEATGKAKQNSKEKDDSTSAADSSPSEGEKK